MKVIGFEPARLGRKGARSKQNQSHFRKMESLVAWRLIQKEIRLTTILLIMLKI
jgi:hypothetical protein